ncbi:phage tail protein [Actinotalea solisilvae]|uniref:phage tail protein n=1 Tax=Actinotalea solisilvae TaxID=2072922 RepID=UPI0018F231BB|nr:tail fiber protein [Actinotalea solisilvae]
MADPFLGEIRMFAGNFAPRSWAFCHGQLMPISQNTALFSLIGTYYGGDGKSTFALPDLRDATPVHWETTGGAGHEVPPSPGASGGTSTVTLLAGEMPAHTHAVRTVPSGTRGTTGNPSGSAWARSQQGRLTEQLYSTGAGTVAMSPAAVSAAGGGQPHNNRSPYLTVSFIIALQGIYPPRP